MEIKDVHAPKTLFEDFTYPRRKDVNNELNILKRNLAEELSSLPKFNFIFVIYIFPIHKCKDS